MKIRKLKTTALAVVAVVALSAASASAASAAKYNTEYAPAYLKAESSSGVISFSPFGSVSCQSGTLTAQTASTSVSSISTTSYEQGCFHGGFGKLNVAMNGCSFRFDEPTGAGSPYSVPVGIDCPVGAAITIKSASHPCTVSIGAQTPKSTSTITNNAGPPKTASLNMYLSAIAYTPSGGAFCGSGLKTNGIWQSQFLVKAYKDVALTKQIGFYVA